MKRRIFFSRQADVIDVHSVRDLAQRPWSRSPRILGTLAIILAVVGSSSWWTYFAYLKPLSDQERVDEAITLISGNPAIFEFIQGMSNYSADLRLITLAEIFRDEDTGIPTDIGIRASQSALDLAIFQGSREARLALGKSIRDGDLGEKDPKAALTQFQIALEELQPGIRTGDQDALYVYSLMLKEGLGVDRDPIKAREILKRVALSRDYPVMYRIGTSALWWGEERDLELVKAISRKLIGNGHPGSYSLGTLACAAEYGPSTGEVDQIVELVKAGDQSSLAPLLVKNQLQMAQQKRCELPFLQAAADKGEKNAKETLASLTTKISQPILREQRPPVVKASEADPEAQSRTGYLIGTKQIAQGGLSTFKVDKTKGGGDAVVRLYRGGKKPSARNMFVKNGESFTAGAVAPGAYRLRYRYIGSVDTFEAEETFTLAETPTENGTRFSTVTVTLYKVANGNLSVKKVDASEF